VRGAVTPAPPRASCVRSASSGLLEDPNENRFLDCVIALFCRSVSGSGLHLRGIHKGAGSLEGGFVFGISQYMSAVAQPDEEPPYPVRTTFQRCLASSTDTLLVRQVEAYVAASPARSKGPMVPIIIRAFFNLCRAEIEKAKSPRPAHTKRGTHTTVCAAGTQINPTSKLPINGFLRRLENAAPDSHALWAVRAERGSNIAHAISINRSGSREKIGPG